MAKIPHLQTEPPEVTNIKATGRAKLSWITPLCCLILFPMFEKTSLMVGIGLGVTFLVLSYLDIRHLDRQVIWTHTLAGSVITLLSVILLVTN